MVVDNEKAKKCKRGYKKEIYTPHYKLHIELFAKWLVAMGYAETTIYTTNRKVATFFFYLEQQHIKHIEAVTPNVLTSYNAYLHQQHLGRNTIVGLLNGISLFGKYLEKTTSHKLIFSKFEIDGALPFERAILTTQEAALLFADLQEDAMGYLQRAFLHLCYSCGLRIGEVVRVKVGHIDYENKLLEVIPGKNHHGRYIPLSTRICKDLLHYENYARPQLNSNGHKFLVSQYVNDINVSILRRLFKVILKKYPHLQERRITAHSLRHSIATHLLAKGMNLESIAQFLGHQSLDSTTIYTRVNHQSLL